MVASVGSVAEYLEKQEFGGTGKGTIPTPVSSGEGRGARPRKRLVRRPNRMGSITLAERRRVADRRQRNAIAIRAALKSGRKFVFLELERRKGLFRLKGGKRNPQVDMLWDLSRKSVRIRPNPTLGPTLRLIEPRLLEIHAGSLLEQLKRNRVFGY
jgi:hypothetical protein